MEITSVPEAEQFHTDTQQQEESETEKEPSEAEKNRSMEIYKLHAQLASELSNRLGATNRFYPAIMSGLIVIYFTFLQHKGAIFPDKSMNALVVGISTIVIGNLGAIFLMVWFFSIESYLERISRKYEILMKLEDKFDFQFFRQEWELLGEQKKREPYEQLSQFEFGLPFAFLVIFFVLTYGGFFKIMPALEVLKMFLLGPAYLFIRAAQMLFAEHRYNRKKMKLKRNGKP